MDTAGGEFYQSEVRSLMRYGFSGPQYYRRSREHYPALRADRVSRIPGATSDRPDPDPKPLLVGELGGYIYFPDLDKFRRQWGGRTPWPILRSAGLGWGALGERMADGYEERFRDWGLDEVYGGFAGLAERHDWSAFADIKDEVEQIRKGPDVTGYVFTMFSNIGPYVHGLLDYDLSLRAFHGELARLNSPDLLIVDWEELNYWPGETVRATLLLSHYGTPPDRRLHGALAARRLRSARRSDRCVDGVGGSRYHRQHRLPGAGGGAGNAGAPDRGVARRPRPSVGQLPRPLPVPGERQASAAPAPDQRLPRGPADPAGRRLRDP